MGETRGYFGAVIESGFHETSMRMVRDGEVDASAIDSQVLAIEMRDHPEIADTLRVIDALGPSTIQPVAVSKRWEPDFREAIRDVLTDLHRRPGFGEILDHGMIESFVEVGPESYDDIRRMLETCERAAFMVIR
jgi:phosphonate transport system substrate-binding protein